MIKMSAAQSERKVSEVLSKESALFGDSQSFKFSHYSAANSIGMGLQPKRNEDKIKYNVIEGDKSNSQNSDTIIVRKGEEIEEQDKEFDDTNIQD